jgi:alkylation response protein AidB-like acyl-CoA dehydrogenase
MLISLEAMRNLVYHAGWKLSNNFPFAKEAAMAKIWADEAYKQITTLSFQIHGAIGFTEDYELSSHWLRNKPEQFVHGNSEYLSDLVAREIGL